MSTSGHNLLRFFRGPQQPQAAAEAPVMERFPRRSSGLGEFHRAIAGREELAILDLGPTSATNITRFTNLGHKVYNEDLLLASTDPTLRVRAEDGNHTLDVPRFFRENLNRPPETFDAVLCWDVPDYLPEELVKPMVERLRESMKPGGALLAFFHSREAGPDAPYYRYHIAANDLLELQERPSFRLQRVFNNRHIENLFRGFHSLKFFLARDHIREVLVVR